jgi:hypothetical protein
MASCFPAKFLYCTVFYQDLVSYSSFAPHESSKHLEMDAQPIPVFEDR